VQRDRNRQATVTGILSAVLGVILFAWFVRRVGPREVLDGLRQVGWGVGAIVAIAGLRFAARAAAWRVCLEPPYRLPFAEAFAAVIAGDAFGNLTPLGPIVGEPAKAAFVRPRVPIAPALTALAIENLFYTLTVAAVIAASMVALIFSFPLPEALRDASEVTVVVLLAMIAIAAWVLWRRPAMVQRALAALLPAGSRLHARLDSIGAIEQDVYTFAARRQNAFVLLLCAELAFHALGVLEVHVTWWMMQGAPPPLLTSFILEGANRLITVVFKFVPLRVGVDEVGTAGFTRLLGYGEAPGTTLAIIRKIRVLFWTTIGTALLVRRGLSPRRILEDGASR
jgi:hypothetical protein